MATKFWPPEAKSGVDRKGGRIVRQLTAHKAHSFHIPAPWWDSGRKILFGSDRGGKSNLYSVDLQTAGITQHTDSDLTPDTSFLFATINPTRPEAYFWRGNQVFAVDLVKNQERLLHKSDANFMAGPLSVTADGKFIVTAISQHPADRLALDLLGSGSGFREYWESKPESRLMSIPIDGGQAREIYRERCWLGHVQASPTQAHIAMFNHEGPEGEVDQRNWGIDLRLGKPWAIRPSRERAGKVNSAYWFPDGVTVAYRVETAAGQRFAGRTRFDVGQALEYPINGPMDQLRSIGQDLLIADGGRADPARTIRAWRWNGVNYDGPRTLCEHGASYHVPMLHPRPVLSSDGKRIVFTSDRGGYAQVHDVELGSFESLAQEASAPKSSPVNLQL